MSRPPRWARALVERLAGGAQREFVLGDLEEEFGRTATRSGRRYATALYLVTGLASGLGDGLRAARGELVGDVRYALRQMRRHPGFHAGASIVLALGLGAGTLTWGIRYGVLGHGLPVDAPERMVAVLAADPRTGEPFGFSRADLALLGEAPGALAGAALWSTSDRVLADADHAAERISVLFASHALAGLLEVRPLRGRALVTSDLAAGAPPVALLGHELWSRRYRADPEVVGRTVEFDGRPTRVVGVLPPGPTFAGEDAWLPLPGAPGDTVRAHAVLARLAAGVDAPAAERVLSGLAGRFTRAGHGPRLGADPERTPTLRVVPFSRSFFEPAGPTARHLRVVTRVGWLLFAMALANVANLFLVRTRRRGRELAVRRALGAGRGRVARQVVLEVAPVVLLGAVGGAAIAAFGLEWHQGAQRVYAGGGPGVSWQQWRFEAPHLPALGGRALLAAGLLAAVVALASLRGDGGASFRAGRGTTSRFRLARGLVALEIAGGGALFLLAALMMRSAWNLRAADWGFAVDDVMTAHVVLDGSRYDSPAARASVWAAMEADLRDLPGVESAALATQLPMIRYAGEWGARRAVEVEGREPLDGAELPRVYVDAVTSAFFQTFEAPLAAGRAFTTADDAGSEPVVVVNTDFVRAFFPEGDVIGRRVRVHAGGEPGPWRTVVGVAPHLWMDSDEDREPAGLYLPFAQTAPPEASLAVRVRGDPAASAAELRGLASRLLPGTPVGEVRTMRELIRFRTRLYRKDGPFYIAVGIVALLLAVVGLYAVVAYIASERVADLGIRAALGASRTRLVIGAVMWGVPALVAGIPAGVAAGLWLTRGFARFMFRVDPWSPGVAAAGFGVLALTAILASVVPAVRAGRVDLAALLRRE